MTDPAAAAPGSKPNEGVDPAPTVIVDTVNLRFNIPVDHDRMKMLSKYHSTWDVDGAFVRESGFDGDLYVQRTDDNGKISGSLFNWAVKSGVLSADDKFGPAETADVLDALEERFGLPPQTLYSARVGRLDYAADLVLPRSAEAYIAACSERARSTLFRFGGGSMVYKTSKHDLAVYDKTAESLAAKRPVAARHVGRHVLRIEDRRRDTSQYFGRPIIGADLADRAFRQDLAQRWRRRALTVPLTRETLTVCPETKSTHRDALAVRGLAAVGGLEAEVLRIRSAQRECRLTTNQAKTQIRSARELASTAGLTSPSYLAAELSAAIDAAGGAAVL